MYWLHADKKDTSNTKAKILFMVVALDIAKIGFFLFETNLNDVKRRFNECNVHPTKRLHPLTSLLSILPSTSK